MSANKLAKIISTISSPYLVIPLFGIPVTAYNSGSAVGFLGWYVLFILLAIGVPLAYVVWGVKTGRITDLHVMIREQRLAPLLLATAGAAALSVIYQLLGAPHELFVMALILTVNGLIFTPVSHSWKISIHASSYAGSVLIVAGLVSWAWLLLWLLLPAVIWARIKRDRHSLWQGLAAVMVASVSVLAMLYLFN